MTIRLFDFSLLTKMRPVSLAAAGAIARTTASTARHSERRSTGTCVPLPLQNLCWLPPAYARPPHRSKSMATHGHERMGPKCAGPDDEWIERAQTDYAGG